MIFVLSIFEWPLYTGFTVQEQTNIDMNGGKRVHQDQILFNRKIHVAIFFCENMLLYSLEASQNPATYGPLRKILVFIIYTSEKAFLNRFLHEYSC